MPSKPVFGKAASFALDEGVGDGVGDEAKASCTLPKSRLVGALLAPSAVLTETFKLEPLPIVSEPAAMVTVHVAFA